MPPTWKKVAEDKSERHPEYGKEERSKWKVGNHTVSVTNNIYGLHVKVDNDKPLINTTPEKLLDHVIKKVSGE